MRCIALLVLACGLSTLADARSKRKKKVPCADRVGCDSCTDPDNACLWCSSPRACLDAKSPQEELDAQCPETPPRDSCLDFNLDEMRLKFVRPCMRAPGGSQPNFDGCCGDGVCKANEDEDDQNCPVDCKVSIEKEERVIPQKKVESDKISVFGQLEEIVHDTYHCEDTYDKDGNAVSSPCSSSTAAHRPSQWLEQMLRRDPDMLSTPEAMAHFKAWRVLADEPEYKPLNFKVPPFGSRVVEFGAGLGQDTRNLAKAGYRVLGVEVSDLAASEAKALSKKTLTEEQYKNFEYVNYDALALPAPQEKIDWLADFTVYCGLRHRYLGRMYELWERIIEPEHTLFMVSCWKHTTPKAPVPVHREDMMLDFAPMFEILQHEECMKNQGLGGPKGAWCMWMRMKPKDQWTNFSASVGDAKEL